jgi:hypothetical protein
MTEKVSKIALRYNGNSHPLIDEKIKEEQHPAAPPRKTYDPATSIRPEVA